MRRERAAAALQLAAGGLIGLLSFAVIAPALALKGGADGFAVHEDQLNLIANLRYFVWDSWRWPLMRAAGLGSAAGTVIVFNDGIPLYALALRLARRMIDPEFNFIGAWLGFCYAMQGLAGAAAARMWGVTRWMPCLAAAAIAASMDAWLAQLIHAGLCCHAFLLVACGLFGLASRWPAGRIAMFAVLLCWTALLVNAYLFVMVAALAAALIAFLVTRGWSRSLAAAALGVLGAGALLEMALLGFFEPHGWGRGFSFFSMNLLSPFYPPRASLLGRIGRDLDATGGQYEGLNFLGLGLWILVPVALWCLRGHARSLALRYRPLLAAAIGLTCFSLSNRIFFGNRLFLLFPMPPPWIAQFRAPGRFFWPVAYLVLIAVVVAIARQGKRFDGLLVAAALLQWADAAGIRETQRSILERRAAPILEKTSWSPVIRAHARVVISPSWECASVSQVRTVEEAVYLASISRTETSTFHNGRPVPVDCGRQGAAFRSGGGLDAGTLLVALDGAALPVVAEKWTCARFSGGRACSARPDAARLLAPIGTVSR